MRGLFYSSIALMFVIPLVIIVISNINFSNSELGVAATKVAGGKIASYAKSIDDDLPRALDIMAKRAVTQAVVYLEVNGTPYADSASVLAELIVNGTIYGQLTDTNFTVSTWTFLLADKGKKYGFDTQVGVAGTRFFAVDSRNVGVEISISVNVTNSYTAMNLYRVFNSTASVPVEGFNDPVYTLNTNGILKRSIKFANFTVSGTENFDSAVDQRLYMPSAGGAGFLDRLEGRLYPSGKYNATETAGMETIVFLPDLQSNGIAVKNGQTNVDYLYFDSAAHAGSPVNQSSHSWMKMDAAHAATYNITII